MRRYALTCLGLACIVAFSTWAAHLPAWVWHPLLGKGYQLWSGVASDIGEITVPIEMITIVVTVRHFLHLHFECHEESCSRLGLHHVEGTHHKTCWEHHPVLSRHPKHGVPLRVIHEAHTNANR